MTRTNLPPPPVPVPDIRCRCCGQPLRVEFQPGFADRPGYFLCTCDNRNAGNGEPCLMLGFTLGDQEYVTKNLQPYIATALKKREAVKA